MRLVYDRYQINPAHQQGSRTVQDVQAALQNDCHAQPKCTAPLLHGQRARLCAHAGAENPEKIYRGEKKPPATDSRHGCRWELSTQHHTSTARECMPSTGCARAGRTQLWVCTCIVVFKWAHCSPGPLITKNATNPLNMLHWGGQKGLLRIEGG